MTSNVTNSNCLPLHVVILGAGAIGNALAEYLLFNNHNTHVLITYHRNRPKLTHQRLTSVQLDATVEEDFLAFKKTVINQMSSVNWIINTIGILHDHNKGIAPEKRLLDFNHEVFSEVLTRNVLPTVYAAKHLAPLLDKHSIGIFAAISAKVGSIEDNRQGGWYSYRASKACLNMMMKTISIELGHKNKNTCVLALHPGTTDSHLSEPFQKNVPKEKLFTPQRTAEQLINILQKVTPTNSGCFYNWDGTLLPW